MTKAKFDRHQLHIPLKGRRTYVRGADIYSAVMEIVLEKWLPTGRCRLAFHKMPHRRLELLVGESTEIESPPDTAIADLSVVCDGALVSGWIYETNLTISESIPFDEDRLMGETTIAGSEIATAGPRNCQPIDLAVALTKTLHNKLRPLANGQWIFTRVDIERPLTGSDTEAMSIRMSHEFGTRLTRSEIRVAQQSIGSIFFSVVPT